MYTVNEIQEAIERLSQDDLCAFRHWFAQRVAMDWDRQFEADVAAGRFDALADEAIQELSAPR